MTEKGFNVVTLIRVATFFFSPNKEVFNLSCGLKTPTGKWEVRKNNWIINSEL